MRVEHTLPEELVKNRPLRILVVGAGGTGSAIVMGLPYLDQAMRVWGHRFGLTVALMDALRFQKRAQPLDVLARIAGNLMHLRQVNAAGLRDIEDVGIAEAK